MWLCFHWQATMFRWMYPIGNKASEMGVRSLFDLLLVEGNCSGTLRLWKGGAYQSYVWVIYMKAVVPSSSEHYHSIETLFSQSHLHIKAPEYFQGLYDSPQIINTLWVMSLDSLSQFHSLVQVVCWCYHIRVGPSRTLLISAWGSVYREMYVKNPTLSSQ